MHFDINISYTQCWWWWWKTGTLKKDEKWQSMNINLAYSLYDFFFVFVQILLETLSNETRGETSE